ncbi:Nup93/Nic96-domain-containing protein [Kockovaella imperatae]|uniref:Nuclear pore protein n=1 Tax=Kockovaella imperatae TaxID=4999 RepID=A0A1Y1U8A5_9TREE|nr:Nup93/Nic96-domain-containing protein [Kockovaella imperatae]ORX34270.1 Nup93/Nic96-domain-containing protein [Kockovaella imperatae]
MSVTGSLFKSQNGSNAQASTSKSAQPVNFTSLLAQANSLNDAGASNELPQLRFGLGEIEQMSESVASRGKRGKSRQGEGYNLLSSLGVNTTQLSHDISQLPHAEPSNTSAAPKRRRRPAAAGLHHVGEPSGSGVNDGQDVGSWGRNWHETIILSGIEYQRQKTIQHFQDQFQARMLANWEAEKARVLQEELGVTDDDLSKLTSSTGKGALGSSVLGRSALGTSTRRFPMASSSSKSAESRDGGLVMHTKMIRYERVISELNARRLRKEPLELCQALMSTVEGDTKYPQLPTAYRILGYLVHEPSLSDSEHAEPIQERQYANAYLVDPTSSHASLLRGRLAAGGRRFLERDFEKHIDETIAKHPKEAAIGGLPGVTNKIRAYVDVLSKTKDLESFKPESVDGTYLWAQVYFLFRCGYLSEALDLLTSRQSSLRRDDYSFPGALKTYLSSSDRRLPKAQKDQLYNDFNSHIRNSTNVDQYKYALYKLVGRFELSRKSAKVAATTEDWIWLQLCLVRESRDDGPQQSYTVEELGGLVLKYGSEKFDSNGSKPFAWFNLLLFAGQYERAIAYLHSKQALRTDAVHFASALQYYGLLRLSAPDADILTEAEDDTAYLNLARIVKSYISPFAKLEPQTALQYAYLIALGSDASNGSGQRQKTACLELIRDIVLASRAWSKLLGSVRADGSKETGIIERDLALLRLNNSSDYLRHVVLSAADQSALDASLTDSIELYHLAGAYDKVVESINRALGSSLSLPMNPGPSVAPGLGLSGAFGGVQDLYGLAQRVHQVYEHDLVKRNKVSKMAWDTLGVLIQLKAGLSQFAAERPDLALETLRQTGLLPLSTDPSSISSCATAFKSLLDQPTISSLDEVIVTTMKCLFTLSQQLKRSDYADSERSNQIIAYKQMAQNVVQFASGLRLRLGPDVYRQLSSMSAFF